MSSIDERIVRLKFDNQQFEQGVAKTRASLDALKRQLETPGSGKGLTGITSGVDKLGTSFKTLATGATKSLSDVDTASKKVTLEGVTHATQQARDEFGRFASQSTADIGKVDQAAKKVDLTKVSSGTKQARDEFGKFASEGVKDIHEVESASNHFSLGGLSNGLSAVAGKFKALSVIGVTALATITQQAVSSGLQMVKALTLAPIMDGFREYETNINSIQTILANTQQAGTTLKDVGAALNELNHYADQTIYNFSEMTKNIGTFTSAGVDLKTSTAAIKGIANVAAMAGANSEAASRVMYQLSQAISSNKVSMEDWTSVVNAGMASSGFQRALAMNAEKIGTLKDGAVKLHGAMKTVTIDGKSFTDSIRMKPGETPWLTSKVLLQTLKQFTGDMTDAQLKAEGFSKAEIKMIQAQAKAAKESATQVKTLSQLWDTTKEALGSGWASTWQIIFGDFTQAKGLFTGISKAIGNVVSHSANARNKMLSEWSKLGGRDDFIKGLSNSVKALGSVLKPIGAAFREIFPRTTGKQLADMSKNFKDFTASLKVGSETADKLKRTFAGVFAIFGIAWDLIKGFLTSLGVLFGVIRNGSGGFLDITAKIGDFIVKLKNAMEQGDGMKKFFLGLGKVLSTPIQLLQKLTSYIGKLFGKFDGKKASAGISDLGKNFGSLSDYTQKFSDIWNGIVSKFTSGLNSAKKALDPFVKKFKDLFGGSSMDIHIPDWIKNLGKMISDGFSHLDVSTILKVIQTGLLGGIFLVISKFFKNITNGSGGIFDSITQTFTQIGETVRGIGEDFTNPLSELTKTLRSMQHVLQATTLLEIAAAILIMAVAVGKLSKIDQAGLMRSSAALSVMFGQLLGSMAIFQKFIGTAGFLKMPFVMASLILLAEAVNILASAMTKLAKLDWQSLGRGLSGLAGIILILAGAIKLIGSPKRLLITSIGLNALATAIGGLVVVVKSLSKLSWSETGRGLAGLAGILLSLGLFTKLTDISKAGSINAIGIILLGVAIKVLASAVKDFSDISWENIGKGLAGVAALLGTIMLYEKFTKANAVGIAQSIGIVILAGAIKLLVYSVQDFSKLSWQEIAKGLVGVGALLGSLVLFTKFSKADAAGIGQGVGIILLATGIKILASAAKDFAKISWNGIAKGIASMAGSLAIIAGALMLIPPNAPLGAAAVLIVALALGKIGDALQQMSELSWANIGSSLTLMLGAFTIISAALILIPPTAPLAALAILGVAFSLKMIGQTLSDFAAFSWVEIAKASVLLYATLGTIAGAMILMLPALPGAAALLVVSAALMILAPVLTTFGEMSLESIVKSLIMLAGAFTILGAAGILLIPAIPGLFLLGAAIALIGVGVMAAGLGLTLFAGAIKLLGQNVGNFHKDIDKAGPGMTDSIKKIMVAMANAVIGAIPKIVGVILRLLIAILAQMNKYMPTLIDAGSRLMISFLNGIAKHMSGMVNAATNVIVAFLNGVSSNLGRVIDAGVRLILAFINGCANSIRAHSGDLRSAGINLATAIIDGMTGGLISGIGRIASAAADLGRSAIAAARRAIDSHSPSKEFIKIGEDANKGFYIGLTGHTKDDIDKAFDDLKAKLKDLSKNTKVTAAERKKAADAYKYLTKNLADEHKKLDALGKAYDKYTEKIKAAKQALVDIKKTRDDFKKQITDQYSVLPDISSETSVANYESDLKTQIEKTKEFSNTLQRLRDLGLNDDAYKQLLSKGIDALPFAKELLAGGKNAVNEINSLDSQLASVSKSLGKQASSELYDAAVHAAEGFVRGLESKQKAIERIMDKMADAMVKAIKKKLGIKSPSREFMKVGNYSAQGLIKGWDAMAGSVAKSASDTGKTAVEELRKSLSGFSDLITADVDLQPTITPVLDLSSVKKGAGQIGSILPGHSVSVESSYSKAKTISAARAISQEVSPSEAAAVTKSVSFVQNNYSPKALSSAEIYRQTKNQLSRAKGALNQ